MPPKWIIDQPHGGPVEQTTTGIVFTTPQAEWSGGLVLSLTIPQADWIALLVFFTIPQAMWSGGLFIYYTTGSVQWWIGIIFTTPEAEWSVELVLIFTMIGRV